jgi:hypothetical protein
MTGGRYPVLRALAILYLLGALGVLCYGLYWIGWMMFRAPASMGDRFSLTLQALAATFFGVVTILALAELIKLVIDIEHNTRIAATRAAGIDHPAATVTTTTTAAGTTETMAVPAGGERVNRIAELDEESAEAALLRGH